MLIKTIALVNLVGLFLFGALFPAEIRVSQDTPAMMTAGSEVKVTVNVDKGELSGFAKLQIDLPAGMSATAIETKGASFTFADGKAKFIWMALPASPKFNITYTLKADATMSGSVNLNGKLSYIEDNERKTYDIPTSTVQITGGAVAQQAPPPVEEVAQQTTPAVEPAVEQVSPAIEAANDIVSAAGAAPVSTEPLALPAPGPIRMIPAQQGAGSVGGTRTITAASETEMLVEVTISKGSIRGFGKLQESIPAGFTALEKNTDEAIFTSQGTIVKFVWLNLPAKNELKVSYKLRGTGQPNGDYVVNGEFGYLLNDETQKAVLGSTSFKTGPEAMLAQQQTQGQDQGQQAQEQQQAQEAAARAAAEKQAQEQQQALQQATAQQTTTPKTTSRIPAPETGVSYKVQITAAHREVGPEYFAERHRFMGEFSIERHEGWIKYTTGRFPEYRAARDQRQAFVAAGNNFPGPFVTAYNNGDRITVQEALMISQQHWMQ